MRDRNPGTVLQAWGAVDPLKGPAAIVEAERAVRDFHVLGFHFHPIMGRFEVNDRAFRPLFDAIDGLGVPVMIDVGTTGMGAGLPGGLGATLRSAHPLCVDDLAATFPNLTILAAHPGWPWVEEMTAVALHKGNVYWEMSGWAHVLRTPSCVQHPGELQLDLRRLPPQRRRRCRAPARLPSGPRGAGMSSARMGGVGRA